MFTRYILHGGGARDDNNQNTNFFQEILKAYEEHANVLLVQFATPPEKQSIYKQSHIAQFERAKGQKV